VAAPADRQIKDSSQQLREARRGRVTDHQHFLLHLHLQYIEFANAAMQDVDPNVARAYHPDDQELKPVLILMTVPGIDLLSARGILSAIGRNMSRSRSRDMSCRGVVSAQR
jgi:hypothetical protein